MTLSSETVARETQVARIERIREVLAAQDREREGHGNTHWDGCFTYHWSCAVRVLLEELDRLAGMVHLSVEDASAVLMMLGRAIQEESSDPDVSAADRDAARGIWKRLLAALPASPLDQSMSDPT